MLPEYLRGLFWDQEFERLSWPEDKDPVTARVLVAGGSDAIAWLRKQLGEAELREWLRANRGRELSRRQLRYWQIVLELPCGEVDDWLAEPGRRIWEERTRR